MVEIKAPFEYTDNKYKIFLAGSIEMGVAEKWQQKITDSLKNQDIILLNPRREDWDSSWIQSISNPKFIEQVSWELKALEDSDIILMYFDPNTKSPISLLELGLYAKSEKLYVCCPDGFWRKGNVEIVCEKYNIPLFHSMDEMIHFLEILFS